MNGTQQQLIRFTFLLIIAACSRFCYANECSIHGLPTNGYKNMGNVFVIDNAKDTQMNLTLECRCSFYSPRWQQYSMKSMNTVTTKRPIQCIKDGKDCSPITYISKTKESKGFYLYLKNTFEIKEPTMLMCSSSNSSKRKLVVAVSVKEEPTSPVIITEKCDPPKPTPAITVSAVLSVSDSAMNVLQSPTMPAASGVKLVGDSKDRQS